jgi:hypothetical protein
MNAGFELDYGTQGFTVNDFAFDVQNEVTF